MPDRLQIPNMNLVFDKEQFPQITSRHTAEELRDVLLQMCSKGNLPITELSMYSQAVCLESNLEKMFPGS
jgi:hypothetical protein